jgi:hypothetical protein
MLQMFHMDIAKVDQDVASVSEACCKRLFKMFHLFQTYVARVLYLDVTHVLHVCYKSMFKMFQLFQSYVALSVFMLQIASVLSGCCICFTHTLQVYVPNILSASDVCCIQVFHVASVLFFKGMFRESWACMAWAPVQGVRRARGQQMG